MVLSRPDAATLKATGNAALHVGLKTRRQPLFLRRNLEIILDIHERRLLATMSACVDREDGDTGQSPLDSGDTISRDLRLKTWCGTSAKALRAFLEVQQIYGGKPPMIEVSRLSFHRRDTDTVQVTTPAATPSNDLAGSADCSDPEWLIDQSNDTVPCRGIVSSRMSLIRPQIFSGHLTFSEGCWTLQPSTPLLVDVLGCPSRWVQNAEDNHSYANDQDGSAVEEKFGLTFKIFTVNAVLHRLALQPGTCRSPKLLHTTESRLFTELGEDAIVLHSKRDEIELEPRLPTTYHAKVNHQGLLMDVSLQWRYESASALERFYERTKCMYEPAVRSIQFPTPSVSVDTEDVASEVEITMIFQNKTQHTQKRMVCPFCTPSLDFKQFRRLHLHLLLQHDHFSIEVEDDQRHKPSSVLRKIIRLDLAKREPAKANIHDDDTLKINWIAPPTPFDIHAHLNGDRRWVGERTRSTTRSALRGKKNSGKTRTAHHTISKLPPAIEPVYKRLPPDQVPELASKTKVLHPVPFVIDSRGEPIQFFRTNSKRPFETDEMVENSDDDVDDSWIRERRRQNLERLVKRDQKLTPGKARFMADWDTHIDREELHGISGDALKRDSTIRFARQCQHELIDAEYRAGWVAKIMRSQKWNIFDQADVDYCMHLVDEQPVIPDKVTREDMDAGASDLSLDSASSYGTPTGGGEPISGSSSRTPISRQQSEHVGAGGATPKHATSPNHKNLPTILNSAPSHQSSMLANGLQDRGAPEHRHQATLVR